jgi:hypothetical protein
VISLSNTMCMVSYRMLRVGLQLADRGRNFGNDGQDSDCDRFLVVIHKAFSAKPCLQDPVSNLGSIQDDIRFASEVPRPS